MMHTALDMAITCPLCRSYQLRLSSSVTSQTDFIRAHNDPSIRAADE